MARIVEYIPNSLTYLRLVLIPVFVILMINPSPGMVYAATIVFIAAALTDYADGVIARKYQAVTDAGKLLDPLADKILVMAALVMLVAQRSDIYGEPWVPGWIVVIILAREIWVTGLRAVAAGRGVVVAASNAGKLKSVLQMLAIVLLLMHDQSFQIGRYLLTCQLVGLNLLVMSVVISVWGAVEYTMRVLGPDIKSAKIRADLSDQSA